MLKNIAAVANKPAVRFATVVAINVAAVVVAQIIVHKAVDAIVEK